MSSKPKRVLVTWGSKRGGTEGIARIVAKELRLRGFDVVEMPAREVNGTEFDAVVAGGAVYANRWPASLRRFVARRIERLRQVPVWLFSSGPLDESADRGEIPPVREVEILAERIGAIGHATFGGRLEPDAKGFPASAMAKKRAGDWRNPERIRAWAESIAIELPAATPRAHVEPRARSVWRLLGYGVLGWVLVAAVTWILTRTVGTIAGVVGENLTAALAFWAVAHRYFAARGPREPVPTAIAWTVMAGVLDLLMIPLGAVGTGTGSSVWSYWLPLLLILVTTWATGGVMAMMPRPEKQP